MILRRFVVLVLIFITSHPLWSAPEKEKVDLIIAGGTVVTMNGSRVVYDDGAVAVKGGVPGPGRALERRDGEPLAGLLVRRHFAVRAAGHERASGPGLCELSL